MRCDDSVREGLARPSAPVMSHASTRKPFLNRSSPEGIKRPIPDLAQLRRRQLHDGVLGTMMQDAKGGQAAYYSGRCMACRIHAATTHTYTKLLYCVLCMSRCRCDLQAEGGPRCWPRACPDPREHPTMAACCPSWHLP